MGVSKMTKLIHIKMLSENALMHIKKNIELITNKIIKNENNTWLEAEFPQPMFVKKKFLIHDFVKRLIIGILLNSTRTLKPSQDIFFLMNVFGYGFILKNFIEQ